MNQLEREKEDKRKKTSATKEGKGGADMVKKKAKTEIKERRGETSKRPRMIIS